MLKKLLSRPNNYPFRRLLWKNWYNHLASNYSNVDVLFMNYGYADLAIDTIQYATQDSRHLARHLELSNNEEKERYCVQLYHHVTSAISLEGLDVLEIGCGRGGGSAFIHRHFKPKSVTGIDFSESNIEYCHNNHDKSQINFCVGDAEALQFNDCSFDAVVNVESSHCYANMEKFFAEVYRVLRPNGYFLIADFRPTDSIDKTRSLLRNFGFKIVKEEFITANVLQAMELEDERKLAAIKAEVPKYLHILAHMFLGSQGTVIYDAFKNRELEYLCYVLQK